MSTAALAALHAQWCPSQDAVRVAVALNVGEDRLNAVVAMPLGDAHTVLTELAAAVADAEAWRELRQPPEVDAYEREVGDAERARDSGEWWDAA